MGSALGAVTEDRTGLIEQRPKIDVFIGEYFRRHSRGGDADGNGVDRAVNSARDAGC